MQGKRKDVNGRVLRTGESQRKNLRYDYRYTDSFGKRRSIYANDLKELRKKEQILHQQQEAGINYATAKISVVELLERYIMLKQGVRYSTKVNYRFVLNLVKREEFGCRSIASIKISDAKLWFMKLQSDGRSYSTISCIRGIVRPAFQMACDEDVIRKNPFNFGLAGVVTNDTVRRNALTEQEQSLFMTFVKNDPHYSRYYDEFNVLLGTGMRVSELCGLTKNDLDFENSKICVERQLTREKNGTYRVDTTKTASGIRFIPMSDSVEASFQRILKNRMTPKSERMVDGYTGFVFLDRNGNPMVSLHVENHMKWALKKYQRTHEIPLPPITPHVFRHTFCTNMANAGMDVKSLQYIMGHSDASVTMNVYTHTSFEHAKQSMQKIIKFNTDEKTG